MSTLFPVPPTAWVPHSLGTHSLGTALPKHRAPRRLWPSRPGGAVSSIAPSSRSDTLNIVASDHRPFSTKQKAMGKEDFTKIPHGVSGVQDRMNIIWERGVVRGPAAPAPGTPGGLGWAGVAMGL